jgi:hypothetical protein
MTSGAQCARGAKRPCGAISGFIDREFEDVLAPRQSTDIRSFAVIVLYSFVFNCWIIRLDRILLQVSVGVKLITP